jgi:hypothetical protein
MKMLLCVFNVIKKLLLFMFVREQMGQERTADPGVNRWSRREKLDQE